MRVERQDLSLGQARRLGADISEAARASAVQGRVCGEGCDHRCRHCGSTACQCLCSPRCPGAPLALSGDPAQHPIGPLIMPLVYQMKRLGLFTPCWSCEGHLHPDGSLWKLPQVRFTCESVVHLRLLASGVAALKQAGKLRAAWQVVVAHSDPDNPQTTFSLEPEPGSLQGLALSELQGDAVEIARSLQGVMSAEARALLQRAGRVLEQGLRAFDQGAR